MEAGFIYQQPLAAVWCAAFGGVCTPGQPRGCSWDGPDSWAAPPILLPAAVVMASIDLQQLRWRAHRQCHFVFGQFKLQRPDFQRTVQRFFHRCHLLPGPLTKVVVCTFMGGFSIFASGGNWQMLLLCLMLGNFVGLGSDYLGRWVFGRSFKGRSDKIDWTILKFLDVKSKEE